MINITLDGKEYPFLINNRVLRFLYQEKKVDAIGGDFKQVEENPDVVEFIAQKGLEEGAKMNGTIYPFTLEQTGVLIDTVACLEIQGEIMEEILKAAKYMEKKHPMVMDTLKKKIAAIPDEVDLNPTKKSA